MFAFQLISLEVNGNQHSWVDNEIKKTKILIGELAKTHRTTLINESVKRHIYTDVKHENSVLFLYEQYKGYLDILKAQKLLFETPIQDIERRYENAYNQLLNNGVIFFDPENFDIMYNLYESELKKKKG